jgi:hypothetical protein
VAFGTEESTPDKVKAIWQDDDDETPPKASLPCFLVEPDLADRLPSQGGAHNGPSALTVTSSLGADWQSYFSLPGARYGDEMALSDFKEEEPARICPSDALKPPDAGRAGGLTTYHMSDQEMLWSETQRLAMENAMLRRANMQMAWPSPLPNGDAAQAAAAAYWPGAGYHADAMAMTHGMIPGMSPYCHPALWYQRMQMPMMAGGGAARKGGRRLRTESDLVASTQSSISPEFSTEPRRVRAFSTNDVGDASTHAADVPQTTVMLRNLPNNHSRTMLIKLIDDQGFAGQYDFLYLPMDFKSHASLGYAFVNLLSLELAAKFWASFDGFKDWTVMSQKVCTVSWSHPHQGLEAHIERYRNSPVMHEDVPDEYKPMVFQDAVRGMFPPPTKRLRAPGMGAARSGRRGSQRMNGESENMKEC